MLVDKEIIEREAIRVLEEHPEHRTYISDVALSVSMRIGYKERDVRKIIDELIIEGKFTNEEYHMKMALVKE